MMLAHPANAKHEIEFSFRTPKTAMNIRDYEYKLALSYNVFSRRGCSFPLQRYQSRKAQW